MTPATFIAAAFSAAALCATAAFADPAPDASAPHAWHRPGPEAMAAWHARRCNDRYAHTAGRLAYLEASLSVTDAQRGALDRWRDAVLGEAKSHVQACLARAPHEGHAPDALERSADAQKMLETKLAALRSERPALEAFYSSLTPEQKTLFDREGMKWGHDHHWGHGERMGERPDGEMHRAPG
jgi:hypothetical protein